MLWRCIDVCVVYLCDPSPTCGRTVLEVRRQQQNDDVTSQACQNSVSSLLVNIRVDYGVAVTFMHVTFVSVKVCAVHT